MRLLLPAGTISNTCFLTREISTSISIGTSSVMTSRSWAKVSRIVKLIVFNAISLRHQLEIRKGIKDQTQMFYLHRRFTATGEPFQKWVVVQHNHLDWHLINVQNRQFLIGVWKPPSPTNKTTSLSGLAIWHRLLLEFDHRSQTTEVTNWRSFW